VANASKEINKDFALKFVIALGLVSLFADMTYEGARSISGPYLAALGASALVISSVSGLGELIGYGVRLLSGLLTSKTNQYWLLVILGYILNLFVIPLLAFCYDWRVAVVLLLLERLGKAIRSPAKDAMLSIAAGKVRQGFAFGLHEAMDQTGAVVGPLMVALIISLRLGYRVAFGFLAVPAVCAIICLLCAKHFFAEKITLPDKSDQENFVPQKIFIVYMVASALVACAYFDFPLIAYHLIKHLNLQAGLIPVFYAAAMGIDALAAFILGSLFDKFGLKVTATVFFASAFFAPLILLGNATAAFLGVVLWGLGLGAQDSIVKAAISKMVAAENRAYVFGLFGLVWGVAWFVGSVIIGLMYQVSLISATGFSVVLQLMAVPLFFWVSTRLKDTG
jgi:MFS family permease